MPIGGKANPMTPAGRILSDLARSDAKSQVLYVVNTARDGQALCLESDIEPRPTNRWERIKRLLAIA